MELSAGEGARGRAFVEALSRSIGAPVAAATGLIGNASLGGDWELDTPITSDCRSPASHKGGSGGVQFCPGSFTIYCTVTITGVPGNETGTYYLVDDTTGNTIVGPIIIPNLDNGARSTL